MRSPCLQSCLTKDVSEVFLGTEQGSFQNTELLNTELIQNKEANLYDLREGRAMSRYFGVSHSAPAWGLQCAVYSLFLFNGHELSSLRTAHSCLPVVTALGVKTPPPSCLTHLQERMKSKEREKVLQGATDHGNTSNLQLSSKWNFPVLWKDRKPNNLDLQSNQQRLELHNASGHTCIGI